MRDPDEPSPLRLFVKNIPAWVWVAPAVVVHLAVTAAWVAGDAVERAQEGLQNVVVVLIAAGAYLAAPWAVRIFGALEGAVVRSAGEAGCATVIFRLLALASTYALVWATIRDLWS